MGEYNKKKSQNNPQFNLSEHKKKALEDDDKEKLSIIERLEKEIEKLLIIKQIKADQKLLNIYKKDINNVMQEGSYNLIEMIILKEIELLEIGDFEAISMLNKLKEKAQEKINKLSEIALQIQQNQIKFVERAPSPKPVFISKPAQSYKPMTQYEGFHLEKTLGGEIIQTLDADIKNLVGSDIVNSKPEQLSQNIIAEIKNIRQGNVELNPENNISVENNTHNNNPPPPASNANNNSSILKKHPKATPPAVQSNSTKTADYAIKGEWTDLVTNQEKQKSHEVGVENNAMIRIK
jgi:hypothetical protein